jgi:hypothetical protein
MSFYDRLSQCHSQSRPVFILFTEIIAFAGTMLVMVGIAYIRELYRWIALS